jgi:hypothetical protein
MKRILLWLLPIVDIVTLEKIIRYYRSLNVRIPTRHAKLAMLERWVGYLPVGFIISWFIGFWAALLVFLAVFAVLGPVELYLMIHAIPPWEFFKGNSKKIITTVFLLESYNVIGYYLLGVLLAWLITAIF